MESLKNKKFNSLESKKINDLSKIMGGYRNSATDGNGCYDTFTDTPRTITVGHTQAGQAITSVINDQDNVTWWRSTKDTCKV